MKIGLIKEGKMPPDNRVALTPAQCRWFNQHVQESEIVVQPSPNRCFTNDEYTAAGIALQENLSDCDLLLGIKEVPVEMLLENKMYMFFSHTKKKQPYNRYLMRAMIKKRITLIDYECLEHEDGQRIIGFGFFAGVVGAHNGIMAYGERTGLYKLGRVYKQKDYRELLHSYFGLKLPNIKVAVTGSGRVAHGILEVMNLMDIQEVEPDEFKERDFSYPVYVHLKGNLLYRSKKDNRYNRSDFHQAPESYTCIFNEYVPHTDVLMNGVYWDAAIPKLFNIEDMKNPSFRIKTISDITDDKNGSIPCNLGDATIENPVYGVDKFTGVKTLPYEDNSVDVIAIGNLPNELPRDASRFFGEQLLKYILGDVLKGGSNIIEKATILNNGYLTPPFEYLREYAFNP